MDTSPSFTKMSGTGNSFLIIESLTHQDRAQQTSFFQRPRSELAKDLCSNHSGVGADGLIFLEEAQSDGAAFRWDFYNADGSRAEMCGNAARCVARFYRAKVDSRMTNLRFESGAGLITVHLLEEDKVRVLMSPVKESQAWDQYQLINTGVPHLVSEIDEVNLNILLPTARQLRSDERLGPKGANVTYYKKIDAHHIEAYSYERGVEDFTLSCGTGAVAAAWAFTGGKFPDGGIGVRVRGGELVVDFDALTGRPTLTGEARFLAEIQFYKREI